MTKTEAQRSGSILTTWQWLGVIVVIITGMVGIDQRIQATVGNFVRLNSEDHMRIRANMTELAEGIPPEWFQARVAENTAAIRALQSQTGSLHVAITELTTTTRDLRDRIKDAGQ